MAESLYEPNISDLLDEGEVREQESDEIELDLSSSDIREKGVVEQFFSEGCGCHMGPKQSPCTLYMSKDLAVHARNDCLQLESDELDLVILAQLQALRTHPQQSVLDRRSSNNSSTICQHSTFYFHKLRVCLQSFLFVHAVSHVRFEALQKHYDLYGLLPRVHGNSKRLPANTRPQVDTFHALGFIDNISEIHGSPLPGRMPNHRDLDIVLLPSDFSKRFVYRKYMEASLQLDRYFFSRRKFEDLWHELRPNIVTNKPATDLCLTCQQFNDKVSKSFLLEEIEREEIHHSAAEHLKYARTERHTYRDECKEATEQWKEHCEKHPRLPYKGWMHYSFDYAQQIHYPFNEQQPGPAYFLTARKCQLFGVCSEAQSKQVNFLIDEADTTGKGANTTISYVHHFLETQNVGEERAKLHCDNCVGQNKNNAFMFYFLWRVMTGRHKSLSLSFMIAGHTCDRYFGLIKKTLQKIQN